jgi:predicted peptidase
MKLTHVIFLMFVTALIAGSLEAKEVKMSPKTGQSDKVFNKTITKKLSIDYLLYLPPDYDKKDKWPIILFLHGAGERGDDLRKVEVHGPPKIAKTKGMPFIVVSPQCPKDSWWTKELDVLINLLDEINDNYNVDETRVYLTGLSMGGYGSWSLGCDYPDRFAAIAPICGGGEPFFGRKLKDTPVWAFHGAKDSVVPLKKSQDMVNSIKRSGGNAKLTVYPEAGHDSWTKTYDNPQLYKWLLKHTIKKKSEQK